MFRHAQSRWQQAVDEEAERIRSSGDFDWIRQLRIGPGISLGWDGHVFEWNGAHYDGTASYLERDPDHGRESFVLFVRRPIIAPIYTRHYAGFTFDEHGRTYEMSKAHVGMVD